MKKTVLSLICGVAFAGLAGVASAHPADAQHGVRAERVAVHKHHGHRHHAVRHHDSRDAHRH